VCARISELHIAIPNQSLVAAAADIEFVVTDSEAEALILENNLIKKYKPRYNILLKDSKTHPYLVVTMSEPYPRILKVRHVSFNDGNLYFGPFADEYGIKAHNRIFECQFSALFF